MSSAIRNNKSLPFGLKEAMVEKMIREFKSAFETRIRSPWMDGAIAKANEAGYETFHAHGASVFKAVETIMHTEGSFSASMLRGTPNPYGAGKRFLTWVITGSDFMSKWVDYADIFGITTFSQDIATLFGSVVKTRFVFAFVDAHYLSPETNKLEGNLVPVLDWVGAKTATAAPFKEAVLKEAPVGESEVSEPAPAAGAGGAPFKEAVLKEAPKSEPVKAKESAPAVETPKSEPVKVEESAPAAETPETTKVSDQSDELAFSAAWMLIQAMEAKTGRLSYEERLGRTNKLMQIAKTIFV